MAVYAAAPMLLVSVSWIYKALTRRRRTGEAAARLDQPRAAETVGEARGDPDKAKSMTGIAHRERSTSQ